MENRYYIPDLEELIECIINGETVYGVIHGTEDYLELHSKKGDVRNLYKFIEMSSNMREGDITGLNSSLYRVKYLDKTDIEECGFSNKPKDYEHGLATNRDFLRVEGDNIVKVEVYWSYGEEERENLVRIFKGKKYNYPYEEIFRGEIKNKSEFKKVLKMIGYGK